VAEEYLGTAFLDRENNVDTAAMATILNHPNTSVGLSDDGELWEISTEIA
jgi:hypothetical protein